MNKGSVFGALWALLGMVHAVLPVNAQADLSIEPITWDVVGLDSNRPLISGPELFPVGAEVCNIGASPSGAITASMVWNDPDDTYIFTRPGSLQTLDFEALAPGECLDAYYEIQILRSAASFGQSRSYQIEATDGTFAVQTPDTRQIYVEYLVSQNRNVTSKIRWGQLADESDWQTLGGGGALSLQVGQRYYIELTTETSTGYEQLESFLTLSNTIFQVIEVETTYGTLTAPASQVPVPNPRLYADGCRWEPDVDSPNYLSCLADGKAGGEVITTYVIDIISGGGDEIGLEALIYDKSGSSFHYNTDLSESPGDLVVFEETAPVFSKQFIPDTIGADGTSTMRLTISNPNPTAVSDYSFTDVLPAGMQVASVPNLSNSCGGSATAAAGSGTVSLSGGALEGNSVCDVVVDVTAPFDAGASYPVTLPNSVDLLVGDPLEPIYVVNASDDLNVTEFPPPPQICTPDPVVSWDSFDSASFPTATSDPESRSPAAQGGAGLTFSVGSISGVNTEWAARSITAGQTLSAAVSANAYYEFSLDTVGLSTVDFGLEAFRQNGNAPSTLTLFWGTDASSLTQSATLNPVPTRSNAVGFRNFKASNLGNLDDGSTGDGRTIFRVYAYNSTNNNQDVSILSVLLSNGQSCVDGDPALAPDPPLISKQFENPPGNPVTSAGLGEQLTLAFTISNPNADDPLTDVRFADVLPSGLSVVPGTFVNNCTGGVWSETSSDVIELEESSLNVAASCTLTVDVTATAVGSLTNISGQVDAAETEPGNTAQAGLTVEAPPSTPSIVKVFDPNPLFDTAGTTRLEFRISNNDPTATIEQVGFSDVLPPGLLFASPLAESSTNCGSPIVVATSADTLEFSAGTIPPNTDPAVTTDNVCVLSVDVVLSDPGVALPVQFDNITSPVSHVVNGVIFEGNQAEATLLVDDPIPAVAMQKQVGFGSNPDGVWLDYLAAEVGDSVYYRLTAENVGETELAGLDVADPNVDTAACSWIDPLPVADFSAPEGHIDVCIVGPVTIGSSGSFPNTATATATGNGTAVQDSDDALVATAALTVDKQADLSLFGASGQTINYTFTVTNTGDAILSGPVTINDPLVANVSCPALSTVGNGDNYFDPAEAIVCSGSYVTTSTDVSNGSVVNTAFATVQGFDSPPDTVTVPLASASLTISKDQTGGPSPVTAAGQVIEYTIVVENTGNTAQTGVSVTDQFPDGTAIALSSPAESGAVNGQLDVGESWSYGVNYTVQASDISAGANLVNRAVVSTDQVPGPTQDTATTGIVAPQVAVSKNSNPASGTAVLVGDTLTYTLTVDVANGPITADVVLADTPDAQLENVQVTSNPGGFGVSGTTFTLASGATTGSYSVVYTADVAAGASGSVGNNVAITGNGGDPDPECTSCTTDHPVAELGLNLVKGATLNDDNGNGLADVDEVIDYVLTATNDSTVALSTTTIDDPLLTTLDCTPAQPATLNPGEQLVCTGSYTVIQADIDAGTDVVNTATTEAPDPITPTNPALSDTDSASIGVCAESTGHIAGNVWHDINRDGVFDTGEQGYPSFLTLREPGQSVDDAMLTTADMSGNYQFQDIPEGTYELRILEAYLGNNFDLYAIQPPLRTVTVTRCSTAEAGFNFDSPQAGVVGDFVWFDVNEDQAVDEYIDSNGDGQLTQNPLGQFPASDFEWVDFNGNGVPNDGEFRRCGLSDVEVQLLDETGDLIGTDVTNLRGEYFFLGLPLDNAYTTRLDPANPATFARAQELAASGQCKLLNPVAAASTSSAGGLRGGVGAPAGCGATKPLAQTSPTLVSEAQIFDGLDYGLVCGVAGQIELVKELTDNADEDNSGTVSLGDTLSYTITATNVGSITLGNVVVTDTLISPASETCPSVVQNGTCVLTGMYGVTQADVDSGEIPNTATVTSDQTTPLSTDLLVPVPQGVGIELTKLIDSGDPYSMVGDAITYTLTATNSGNVTLADVVIADPQATVGVCTPVQPATLRPNESLTCAASYAVGQPDLDNGSFTNEATVTGREPGGQSVSASDTATANAVGTPSLAVDKVLSDSPDPIQPGSELTYTITTTNTGNITLTGVTVTDPMLDPGQENCASLAPGDSCVLVGRYTVTQGDVDAGQIVNTATGDSSETPPSDDTVTTPIQQVPDMQMVKTLDDAPDPVVVGSVLTYSVTGTNVGNVTLNNVVISDAMIDPSETTCLTLAPGDACVLTGTYTVTQADADAGEIVNVGTAGSDETPPADDTVVVRLGPPPVILPVPALGQSGRLLLVVLTLLLVCGAGFRFRST